MLDILFLIFVSLIFLIYLFKKLLLLDTIFGMSEYAEQVHLFLWAEYNRKKYPCLNYLHASLNGVKLTIGQAVKAKRGGMKKGVPDIHLPFNNGTHTSLYIEMKVDKNKPTTEQMAWLNWLEKQGAKCAVCYCAGDAIRTILDYIGGEL
jgi:hypothetical protein